MSSPLGMIPSDDHSAYGYRPTFFVCVMYIALFSTTLGMHLHQMVFSRYWFLGPTIVLAAFLEVMGWAGRLWSNQNLFLDSPFMLQITTLIIGPTPLLAANFIIFGKLVSRLGTAYSRLRPNLYSWIFLSCDIISLALQGAGGGLASSADAGSSAFDLGTNLMIAGIALQVAMMTVFVALVTEYVIRYVRDRPRSSKVVRPEDRLPVTTKRQILLGAMGFTTLMLFIRAIYRLIELSGGWGSEIMETEWLFNVFDAALVFLAFLAWNIAHPSMLLEEPTLEDFPTTMKMRQTNFYPSSSANDIEERPTSAGSSPRVIVRDSTTRPGSSGSTLYQDGGVIKA